MEHEELTRMNRLLDTTGAPRENAKGVTLSFEARLQWLVDKSGLTVIRSPLTANANRYAAPLQKEVGERKLK